MNKLLCEIQKIKKWTSELPPDQFAGEWECCYDRWGDIYNAFARALVSTDAQNIDKDTLAELIYIVARDNESEWLADEILKYPLWFEVLCRYSLESDEPDAKWQFADRLAKCDCGADVKNLILRFIEDKHEYVARRSLLVLPDLIPEKVESYVPIFWCRECYGTELQEYQRIAALDALNKIQSPLLSHYIDEAKRSRQVYLIDFANKLSSAQSQYTSR